MLNKGDLVKIKDYAFKYFANKLAVVDHVAHRDEYYDDDGLVQERSYYLVTMVEKAGSHIFPEDHLVLMSRAYKTDD
jgi:hypothetical protein